MNPLEMLFAWEEVLSQVDENMEPWRIRKVIRESGLTVGHNYPVRCLHNGRGSVRWR